MMGFKGIGQSDFGGFTWVVLGVCLVLAPVSILAQEDPRSRALTLEQQGKAAEAEAAWRGIAESDTKNAEAFAHLGLLEARREDYPDSIADYRRAMNLNPEMPGLQMNLGLALFKASQFSEAIKVFRGELEKDRGNDARARRLTILLGMAHYGLGDYFVAIPYLRKAADDDPRNLPLRLTLAHSCLWSQQYDCVMTTYKEILALNADSAEADMLAGEALDEKGDDAGAIEQFRAAVKADGKTPNAHFGLGYLLWKQHHFDEAAVEFQAELENDPTYGQARAYLGDSYAELNDYEHAGPELERAAASSTGSGLAMVHRDLGVVYAAAGRKDEAAAELLQAIALDPKDVSPHWRLGKLYQSMGKKAEAKAEFDTASAMVAQNSRPLTQEIGAGKTQP